MVNFNSLSRYSFDSNSLLASDSKLGVLTCLIDALVRGILFDFFALLFIPFVSEILDLEGSLELTPIFSSLSFALFT